MNPVLIVVPTLNLERGEDTGRLARITARCKARVEVICDPKSKGFTKKANLGIQRRRPDEDICLLNDDVTVFHYGWLRILQNALYASPAYGIVGPSGKSISESGAGRLSDVGLKRVNRLPFWCVLIRREVVDQIGLLNEALIQYASDRYYCHTAMQRKWRCVWVKSVYLQHEHRGSGFQPEWWRRDMKTFRRLMELT